MERERLYTPQHTAGGKHNKGMDLGIEKMSTTKFWRAIFAEFFGMTLFLLCVTTVAIPWGNSANATSASNVEIGIGIGLAITSIAIMIGHVSGGHLNPAVSLGMVIGGRINVLQGILYIPAQMIGGILGTALTYFCTPEAQQNENNLGQTKLGRGVKVAQGFGLEVFFSFILVFFVFSITDPAKKIEKYGTCLGIGVCILVCHVCLIPFTGCGINPARSFGPAVVMNVWQDHWIYWVGPMIGGAVAAPVYKYIFYLEEEEEEVAANPRESHAMNGVSTTQA